MTRPDWLPKNRAGWLSLLNVVALIATLAALVVAVIALRDTWRMAEKSGAFDKPNVGFGFGGVAADSSEAELIALIPKRCSAHPILIEIPLTIFNLGKKGASDVSVSASYI